MRRFQALGISTRILLPVTVVMILGCLCLGIHLARVTKQNVKETSVRTARQTASQFLKLRQYYTANVTGKAKSAGLTLAYDHKANAGTIPLPATMIHDLSEEFRKDASGIQLRLYSNYPFPNRRGRTLDEFEQSSIRYLEQNPDATFVKLDSIGGRALARIAIADRLAAKACIDCHNSHAESPKKNWKLGEVRGVLEVLVPIDQDLQANTQTLNGLIAAALVAIGLIVVLVWWFLKVQIVRPMDRIVDCLAEAADQSASASSQLASASLVLAQTASQQAASLEEASSQGEEIASLTLKNSDNSESAVERVVRVKTQVAEADKALDNTNESMEAMKLSSGKISNIIKIIDEIAFQTNILALNAAVEAARAGESGRGFSVVADEVRILAQRSADAAKETAALIDESIGCTLSAGESLSRLVELTASVTRAADTAHQRMAEVSASSQEQSLGARQMAHTLQRLEHVTQTAAASSEEVAATADQLKGQVQSLKTVVGDIVVAVRGRVEVEV